MRIATLRMKDWLCFAGETSLDLDAKAYAIVARRVDDAERSNWNGKSGLIEAIRFALYGTHRHRTEDEWITRGAPSGEVSLAFDDGTCIVRSRHRGKATKLYVHPPGGGDPLMMAEAQSWILERVNLSEEDFNATCFFEQRAMARLVLADPGYRMSIVSGWLQLGPLEQAESNARAQAASLSTRVDAEERQDAIHTEVEKSALAGCKDGLDELHADLASCEEDLTAAHGRLGAAQDALERNEQLIAARSQVEHFNQIVEDGQKLAAEIEAENGPALAEAAKAARTWFDGLIAQVRTSSMAVEQRRRVARGEFDGRCPVIELACPAKDKINSMRAQARDELNLAEQMAEKIRGDHEDARNAWESADAAAQAHDRQVMRLDALREQARRLKASVDLARAGGEPVDRDQLRAVVDRAQAEVIELRTERDDIKKRISVAEAASKERTRIANDLVTLRADLAAERETVVILGKQGAQRIVAEDALAKIEVDANEVLRECGIALSVEVQWSREGQGLAGACDACGHPFPTSTKVKACARCGASRGPKLVNKLDFVLSDRSGAAEDLAGAAIQLAASAWLRRERSSDWSVACVDEPFGALDPSHRRAFGAHLAAMLGPRYSFTQSFVIAHHASALDALPGRIEIVNDGKFSTARVIA